jgi:hypothetical protein
MKLTFVETDCVGTDRFRVIGEPTDKAWFEDWTKRGRPEPSCEFTIFRDRLLSYGGNLWPLAWPELFYAEAGQYCTRPTEQGWILINSARSKHMRKTPAPGEVDI